MSVHFGDLPTWLASIGTIAAVFAALWQIRTERKRRIAQESNDRTERHQAQARLVSAWIGEIKHGANDSGIDSGQTAIELLNGSSEPIYAVVATLVYIQGAAPRSIESWFELKRRAEQGHEQVSPPTPILSIIPPGRWRIWIEGSAWGVLSGRIGAEIAFTDRAGAHWVRRAKGNLEELPIPTLEYFEKHGMYGPPYDYQMPILIE